MFGGMDRMGSVGGWVFVVDVTRGKEGRGDASKLKCSGVWVQLVDGFLWCY